MTGRYWLFAIDWSHPQGGMGDLYRTADSIEDAVAMEPGLLPHDEYYVVDSQDRKMAELEMEWNGDTHRFSTPVWDDIE